MAVIAVVAVIVVVVAVAVAEEIHTRRALDGALGPEPTTDVASLLHSNGPGCINDNRLNLGPHHATL